jgi:hypothetical protein
MEVLVAREPITSAELEALAAAWHGSMVKGVADIARGDAAIEYISLINIRPRDGNRSLELKDESRRAAVRGIAARLVPFLGL